MSDLVPNGQTELIVSPQNTGIVARPQTELSANVPDYLRDVEDMGMDNMDDYVRPSMMCIIEGLTQAPFKDLGPQGTIYLKPSASVVWMPASPMMNRQVPDPPVTIIPLFQYAEFICWNPRGSGLPSIRARTTDKTSDLAMMAKSMRQEERQFICEEFPKNAKGEDQFCTCQESINFIITFYDHPQLALQEAMIPFSTTGLKEGRDWCSTCKVRGDVPLWAQMYGLTVKDKNNAKGDWKEFNPQTLLVAGTTQCAIIPPDWKDYLQHRYNTLKSQYQSNLILAQYEEQQSAAAPAATAEQVANAAKRF